MRYFAPRFGFGFYDVAALPQVNIVIEIFAGHGNTSGNARVLNQTKSLTWVHLRVHWERFESISSRFSFRPLLVENRGSAAQEDFPIKRTMLCHSSSVLHAMMIQLSSPRHG